jgi:hypothetical protein
MFSRFFVSLLVLSFFSLNVVAKEANPFAKNQSVDIGKDTSWKIDKKATLATKTGSDGKGNYYHLQFNNKQLKLLVSSDAAGTDPKGFTQLEIQDVKIDGKQNPVFKWCLNNQQKHNRFLQQGLSVKKNICVIKGGAGTFVMNLNKDTLASLKKGSSLSIMLKPYRTPLDLEFDISDFNDMYVALNAKSAPVATAAATAAVAGKAAQPKKMCKVAAPAKYKSIKPMQYECGNAAAKSKAEAGVATMISQEKAKEQRLAAEREKQRKLAEEKEKQELALKLQQEQQLQVEAAALAASEAKQAQIGSDIADKMVSMCEKYWSKGEHRCYCEKYIDRAPAAIQASSTCK